MARWEERAATGAAASKAGPYATRRIALTFGLQALALGACSKDKIEPSEESASPEVTMTIHNATPATGGDIYIPFDQREGAESVVWFTRDISPEGLRKAFAKVADKLEIGRAHV